MPKHIPKIKPVLRAAFSCMLVCLLAGCASSQEQEEVKNETENPAINEEQAAESQSANEEDARSASEEDARQKLIDDAYGKLNISNDFRASFVHGNKGSEYQKYIVLHDTEGTADASSVIDWWDSNKNLVAAHFVINKDGSLVQCAPLDSIVHHAGFGDTGHNELYGVEDESRDDKAGTTPIGSWASDYGMNSYSVGIEMVHVGGSEDYPEAQLEALDDLIAYIDAYYGFESEIIDHKAWRSGNSDTSPEFAEYFENFKNYRTHKGYVEGDVHGAQE